MKHSQPTGFSLRWLTFIAEIGSVFRRNNHGNDAVQEKLKTVDTQNLAGGVYEYEYEKIYGYKAKRLILNGRSIKQIRVKVYFSTEVIWPRITCRFDISNRGRVIEYEKVVSSTGQDLGIAVIATHTDNPQTPESTN